MGAYRRALETSRHDEDDEKSVLEGTAAQNHVPGTLHATHQHESRAPRPERDTHESPSEGGTERRRGVRNDVKDGRPNHDESDDGVDYGEEQGSTPLSANEALRAGLTRMEIGRTPPGTSYENRGDHDDEYENGAHGSV